jgi:uncharacterized protein YceK
MKAGALLLALSLTNGCGSFFLRVSGGRSGFIFVAPPYVATYMEARLGLAGLGEGSLAMIALLDLPLSFALDTALFAGDLVRFLCEEEPGKRPVAPNSTPHETPADTEEEPEPARDSEAHEPASDRR